MPTSARRVLRRTLCKPPCHCEASAHTGCGNPYPRPLRNVYRQPCVGVGLPDDPFRACTDSHVIRRGGRLCPPAGLAPHSLQCVIARALRARGNPSPKHPLPKGRGISRRLVEGFVRGGRQFIQLSFIPNRIDCSFSFQRLSVWMTSSSVSVFGRICKMENWKNLYRSGCAQITSFISLLCPCNEST